MSRTAIAVILGPCGRTHNWGLLTGVTVTAKMVTVMLEIVFTETAKEQYEALTGKLKRQVDNGLERIAANPRSGKPLQGKLKGIRSERVSTFRLLYKVVADEGYVLVLVIQHRKDVYGGH